MPCSDLPSREFHVKLATTLTATQFSERSGPFFRHWPSTLSDVTCPPLQEDPYEKRRVEVRGSGISGAGDGLFAKKDLEAGETAAFYNGIRVSPGQTPPFRTISYEIFVEWVSNPVSWRATLLFFVH